MTTPRMIWLEEEGYRFIPDEHPEPTDPYEILDVSVDASDVELRKAYRRKAAKYHPDHNPATAEVMKDLNELWQALKNA